MLFLNGGIAAAADGTITTQFLDDLTDVPTAANVKGGIATAQNGTLYVCAYLPAGNYSYVSTAGFRIREDGALCVTTTQGDIVTRLAGIGITEDGEAVVVEGAPDLRNHGIGVLENGTMCVTDGA